MMFTMGTQFHSSSGLLCFACLLSTDKWNLAGDLNYLFENGWRVLPMTILKKSIHRKAKCLYLLLGSAPAVCDNLN